jgi:fermentation-respiration switch protein FrsA (DUF1100 family)
MDASAPSSSEPMPRASMLLCGFALAGGLAAGCVDELPQIEETTSLRVEVLEPTDLGTPDRDVAPTEVKVRVTALDQDGAAESDFAGSLDVYAQFLGSLTPPIGSFDPLARLELAGGVGEATVPLPKAFGPTFLWIEHAKGEDATYATGTSPTVYFRNPWVRDIQEPVDENALDAHEASPLELKQVNVEESRHGAGGRLVVTGVYAQGYTVSDVACTGPDGTGPCTAEQYDHAFVFTFSRPKAGNVAIETGMTIARFTGAVSEFNGLTEINFPQSFLADETPHLDLLPPPVVVEQGWLDDTMQFERAEAGLVAVENATVCQLDAEYTTYKQWKLDIGNGCDDPINVITNGVADVDPADYVGEILPRVVGTLRPVEIGSFHVWIIYPRSTADVTVPVAPT